MTIEPSVYVTPTPYGTFDQSQLMSPSLSSQLTGCKCVYHHIHIYYDPLWTYLQTLV